MSADILPLAQDGVRLLLHAFAVFAGYLVIERMLFLFDRSSRPVDRMDLDVWLRSLGNRGMTALDEMPSSGEDWLSARLTTDVPDEDGIEELAEECAIFRNQSLHFSSSIVELIALATMAGLLGSVLAMLGGGDGNGSTSLIFGMQTTVEGLAIAILLSLFWLAARDQIERRATQAADVYQALVGLLSTPENEEGTIDHEEPNDAKRACGRTDSSPRGRVRPGAPGTAPAKPPARHGTATAAETGGRRARGNGTDGRGDRKAAAPRPRGASLVERAILGPHGGRASRGKGDEAWGDRAVCH